MSELEPRGPKPATGAALALGEDVFRVSHPLSTRPGVEEVELGALELRFEALRVPARRQLEALVRSMQRSGQLNAVLAVREGNSPLVLLDGYRRVRALRRLGADTVWAQVWECELSEALLGVLAATDSRGWEAIEEALLVRELTGVLGLSQHAVAQRTGRDVSWVNRRLKLVESLSEELLEAVCRGELSSWAASRILAPLARANTAHAHALLGALRAQPFSTRDLHAWYQHYQRANRPTRERLVENPALFVRTLRAREEASSSERMRDGPEGQCLADLGCLEAVLKRVRKRLASVCAHTSMPEDLHHACTRMKRAFARLDDDLQRYRVDDPTPYPRGGTHAGSEADTVARDQPHPEALAQHGTADLAPVHVAPQTRASTV